MNSKEEAIKKAYGKHYEELKEFIDVDGWCYEGALMGRFKIEEIDWDEKYSCGLAKFRSFFRLKSLKGIENNRGWIKIEIEDDLPKTIGQYWVIRKDGESDILDYDTDAGFWHDIFDDIECTHWQPIQNPEKPLF